MWGADWKFLPTGNCSASQVILSEGIYNSHPTAIMDSLSSILFLRLQHLSLHTGYFVKFLHQNSYIFGQEIFGSAPTFTADMVDVRTFGGKWCKILMLWHQKDVLTLCMRVILHPSCKMPFPSPGQVHWNFVRVCKTWIYFLVLWGSMSSF